MLLLLETRVVVVEVGVHMFLITSEIVGVVVLHHLGITDILEAAVLSGLTDTLWIIALSPMVVVIEVLETMIEMLEVKIRSNTFF